MEKNAITAQQLISIHGIEANLATVLKNCFLIALLSSSMKLSEASALMTSLCKNVKEEVWTNYFVEAGKI